MVYLQSENVITLSKLIGLLLLFCLPLLYFVFENSKNTRHELSHPVMGTIFLVSMYMLYIVNPTPIVISMYTLYIVNPTSIVISMYMLYFVNPTSIVISMYMLYIVNTISIVITMYLLYIINPTYVHVVHC